MGDCWKCLCRNDCFVNLFSEFNKERILFIKSLEIILNDFVHLSLSVFHYVINLLVIK